ncbi:LADA_0B01024g1_1 [Lachancea dasiensis]|uniref:LADA_0B01024g1_1 n=1 Tax=Lachancea dasiensis TaxID=1072105 RepID=A0A1G4IRS7_9SACH|nr:LADA_0B01024g1_1 [Lachancea dasiensis]
MIWPHMLASMASEKRDASRYTVNVETQEKIYKWASAGVWWEAKAKARARVECQKRIQSPGARSHPEQGNTGNLLRQHHVCTPAPPRDMHGVHAPRCPGSPSLAARPLIPLRFAQRWWPVWQTPVATRQLPNEHLPMNACVPDPVGSDAPLVPQTVPLQPRDPRRGSPHVNHRSIARAQITCPAQKGQGKQERVSSTSKHELGLCALLTTSEHEQHEQHKQAQASTALVEHKNGKHKHCTVLASSDQTAPTIASRAFPRAQHPTIPKRGNPGQHLELCGRCGPRIRFTAYSARACPGNSSFRTYISARSSFFLHEAHM